MENQILTVPMVSKRLLASKALIYRLVAEGQIAAIRFGRSVRIREEDLQAFIQQHSTAAQEKTSGK